MPNADTCNLPVQIEEQFGEFEEVQGGLGQPTVVQLRYAMPNGERRVLTQSIAYEAQMQTRAIFGVVRDSLEKRARHEVQEYVRQNAQRGNEIITYGAGALYSGWNIASQWTTTATNYWQDTGSAGTLACPNCEPSFPATPATGGGDTYLDGYAMGQQMNELADKVFNNPRLIFVNLKFGNKTLTITKKLVDGMNVDITQDDIDRAKGEYFKGKKIQIITRKADRKAEDLLKMFISEVDFRGFKEKGYFIVKRGNHAYKVWRDGHKQIETYEKTEGGLYVPKNRLCVHTERRVCPAADEALTKLLLIRSGKVEESANAHPIDSSMEKELVLI